MKKDFLVLVLLLINSGCHMYSLKKELMGRLNEVRVNKLYPLDHRFPINSKENNYDEDRIGGSKEIDRR